MTEPHRDEIAKLEALHAQHPDGRVFTHLAEAYRKAGELGRALETVEAGLIRHPEYASAHVVRGRILLDLEQADGARAAFRDVLGLDRHNLVALRALGELARDAGQHEEALGYFRELHAMDAGDPELNAEIRRLENELSGAERAAAAAEASAEAPIDAVAAEPEWPMAMDLEAVEREPTDESAPGEAKPTDESAPGEGAHQPVPMDAFADLSGAVEAEDWAEPAEESVAEAGVEAADDDWASNWWSTAPAGAAEESGRIDLGDAVAAWGDGEADADEAGAGAESLTEPPEAKEPAGEPQSEGGSDFHWTFPGWAEEETAAVEVRTETMASLYAAQGLWHRAVEIYRSLVEERPGDAQLEARLAEAEARLSEAAPLDAGPRASEAAAFHETAAGGDQWLEGVESAWTGSQGAAAASASPYDWPEEAGEEREAGPSAGEYLRALAAWEPGGPVVEEFEEGDELDEGESALREWLAEEPAGGAEAAEPGGAVAGPDEATAESGADAEEDEDVEMFRSWLQSLRK